MTCVQCSVELWKKPEIAYAVVLLVTPDGAETFYGHAYCLDCIRRTIGEKDFGEFPSNLVGWPAALR